MPSRPEQALQQHVVQVLQASLPRDAVFWHTPNGGGRSKAEGGIFKSLGVRPGIPDLLVLYRSRLLGIELKAGRGKATEAQLATHERLRRAGAEVTTETTLEGVLSFLREQGVPVNAKVMA